MYARMVPYIVATDERTTDPHPVDPNIGWVIKLPEGKGVCKIEPIHIGMGWGACRVAKQVWDLREQKFFMPESAIHEGGSLEDLIARATSREQLNLFWRNAKANGELTAEIKALMHARAAELA